MIRPWLRARRSDETGASGVEYGLLVALIAGLTIGAIYSLGLVMQGVFLDTCEAVVNNSSKITGGSCNT